MGSKIFNFVIGNPPYQEDSTGDKKAMDSVYHYFMDAAYEVADKVELITPARFLFNNGNTPSSWNKKMLNDLNLKVEFYEQNSDKIFPNTDIKGGVAITYHDSERKFGPIKYFTAFEELNSILKKVLAVKEPSLTTIIYNQTKFKLDALYADFPELKLEISSDGREKRMTSKCFKFPCFRENKQYDDDVQIYGLIDNHRYYRFIKMKYVMKEDFTNFDTYKVILPANNGSGAIGEVESTPLIGTPIIGDPLIGYTQSFISIGNFKCLIEAENCLKFVKSKFSRTMLGVLKVTQNGKKDKWQYVPLQDFTPSSDIDWTQSIHDIDLQLYRKYGLDEKEIEFIETHVKEME